MSKGRVALASACTCFRAVAWVETKNKEAPTKSQGLKLTERDKTASEPDSDSGIPIWARRVKLRGQAQASRLSSSPEGHPPCLHGWLSEGKTVQPTLPRICFESEGTLQIMAQEKEGSKADSVSSNVAALGVVFDLVDLASSPSGIVKVCNTETGRSEIVKSLEAILASGTLSKTDTAALKGHLTSAEGQLFGRSRRSFLNSLSKHLYDHPLNGALREDCRADLRS